MVEVDAVVVGAGPNGLTAAVTLARAGLTVRVYEAAAEVGGGTRTEELTLPGFRHDVCSAVHPLGAGSPAFRALSLERHGVTWVEPAIPLAHPFPDGSAAILARSVAETAAVLGHDGATYRRLIGPFLGRWNDLAPDVLRAQLAGLPKDPLLLARFGVRAAAPAALLARLFRGEHARGLLAGLAAHAMAPLGSPATGGVALLFALAAHEVGWPFPAGGSQALADALAEHLRSLGGRIETGRPVRDLGELPSARAYLLDVMPEHLAALAGPRLPDRFAERLRRYRHGPAAFKIDYALSGPVPWTAEPCTRAGTVHLGPSFTEIGTALRAAYDGAAPETPFLIVAQPTLFDPSRAPAGSHVLWVYGHVPLGWTGDLTGAIERQIERFAPGFGDLVLARAVAGPATVEARNPDNVGGDIAGGACDHLRLLFRPTLARVPYATPDPGIYLCSSATPPGPGVHGMCGHHAALVALRRVFRLSGEEVRRRCGGSRTPDTGRAS
ncbi:NAD(P)/FAD-dependent oxidoreductase [Actinoallomurus purpureus]|uniref:phytoene desaturase family protein n=1 Tax=Actinoallomurus purpureus TaxID=478114 RepID=UPI002093EF34|nr:NAD(P)/FAD-dependent oxidoreductase [Actinoallomurus purpureus]MCO6010471.1 NAD(P)/FAD-dependent oxidoreductase [Actinoallomurus purpureus]